MATIKFQYGARFQNLINNLIMFPFIALLSAKKITLINILITATSLPKMICSQIPFLSINLIMMIRLI